MTQIGPRYEWAAAQFSPSGATVDFEYLDKHAGEDTAYSVAIERCTVKYLDGSGAVPHTLRVTMVFRREDGDWKIAHRHADHLAPKTPRPAS